MSRQQALTPDHLFDRPWRPGRRFAARGGRVRRWGMIGLLFALCLVIGGYAYLADADRVRGMAEQCLSSLIGGRVKVGGATLSIFEGLRLDDVRVYVDDDPETTPVTLASGPASPDAEIFSARTFVVQYNFRSMLRGQLEATQIVAEKPHVHLTQDVRTGEWNFHRLGRERRKRPRPPSDKPAVTAKVP